MQDASTPADPGPGAVAAPPTAASAADAAGAASPRLRFDDPIALVGGGGATADDLREAAALTATVVAADSGCDLCDAAGVDAVAAVIGDMDSARNLDRWRQAPGCEVIEIAEQDTTDFEKCLYTVDAPLYVGVGFFGRRLDHSLAALHVLLKRADKRVVLLGEEDVAFLAPLRWRVQLDPGARVSIVPLAPCRGLRSEGLRWPIDGLDMAFGAQIGTSNEAAATAVAADFDRLGALILLERRYVGAAIDSLRGPAGAAP